MIGENIYFARCEKCFTLYAYSHDEWHRTSSPRLCVRVDRVSGGHSGAPAYSDVCAGRVEVVAGTKAGHFLDKAAK